MKSLVAVLAATLVAGVAAYAILEWTRALELVGTSGLMSLPIWVFVATLGGVGLTAGVLALVFRASVDRGLGPRVTALEARLAQREPGDEV